MQRVLTIYAFSISLVSIFAFHGLANLTEGVIEFWRHSKPELSDLPRWTELAPLITRMAMTIPIALCILTVVSMKAPQHRERWLVHGIGITALALALVTVFTITATVLPSIVTITSSPE